MSGLRSCKLTRNSQLLSPLTNELIKGYYFYICQIQDATITADAKSKKIIYHLAGRPALYKHTHLIEDRSTNRQKSVSVCPPWVYFTGWPGLAVQKKQHSSLSSTSLLHTSGCWKYKWCFSNPLFRGSGALATPYLGNLPWHPPSGDC